MSVEYIEVDGVCAPPADDSYVVVIDGELRAWLASEEDDDYPDRDYDREDRWAEPAARATGPGATGPLAEGPDVPVSLRSLSELAGQDVAAASGVGLIEGLRAWQRFTGYATARMWAQMVELHARRTSGARHRMEQALAVGDQDAAEYAADDIDIAERGLVAELAVELSWSGYRAQRQLAAALTLSSALTPTYDAVASGRLEPVKAENIAHRLSAEDLDLATLVETEILPDARRWTVPELNENLTQALLRAAPELAEQRATAARKTRRVAFRPEPDDMLRMEAFMPVDEGIRVRAALENAAADAKTPGDRRTTDQRVLDTLTDAILALTEGPDIEAGAAAAASADSEQGPGTGGAPGPAHESEKQKARRVKRGLRREIVATVPLETLTGDSDHPGYLARYGPITAGAARLLAAEVARDGYWRCAVTDDTHGTLLGLGRSTYTPAYSAPEHLQRLLNLRDRHCDFSGCRQPAVACDFDHTVPYPAGATCECGGGKRCGNHHRIKHETAWQVAPSSNPEHPPGTVTWTTPTGRQHHNRPPTIGVPTAPAPTTGPTASGPAAEPGPAAPGPAAGPAAPGPAAGTEATADAWAYDPSLPELPPAPTRPTRLAPPRFNRPQQATVQQATVQQPAAQQTTAQQATAQQAGVSQPTGPRDEEEATELGPPPPF